MEGRSHLVEPARFARPQHVSALRKTAAPEVKPRPRQAGMGIASFIIALLLWGTLIIVIAVGFACAATAPEIGNEGSPFLNLFGSCIMGAIALSLGGIVLGIGGIRQPNRRHHFAFIGLTANLVLPLSLMFVIILGLSEKARPSLKSPDGSIKSGTEHEVWEHVPQPLLWTTEGVIGTVLILRITRKRKERLAHTKPAELPVERICARCRKALPPNALFCRRCGINMKPA